MPSLSNQQAGRRPPGTAGSIAEDVGHRLSPGTALQIESRLQGQEKSTGLSLRKARQFVKSLGEHDAF